MSTGYRPITTIHMSDLFDGRLECFNIREVKSESPSERGRCLTDGFNYLRVYAKEDGSVWGFERYGPNNPGFILDWIGAVFDTEIFSEYEPQFWGFNSQEEMDAAF